MDLRGKDMITTQEWTREELEAILKFSKDLKKKTKAGKTSHLLPDKTFFMFTIQAHVLVPVLKQL